MKFEHVNIMPPPPKLPGHQYQGPHHVETDDNQPAHSDNDNENPTHDHDHHLIIPAQVEGAHAEPAERGVLCQLPPAHMPGASTEQAEVLCVSFHQYTQLTNPE